MDIIDKIKDLSWLEIIGILAIILGLIKLLFEVIPQLGKLKDSIINYLASGTLRNNLYQRY